MTKKINTIARALVVALMTVTPVFTNAQAFDEGKSVITVGYGVPNFVKSIIKTSVNSSYTQQNLAGSGVSLTVKGLGPIIGKYEYGLTKNVGVGAFVGYYDVKVIASHTYQDGQYINGLYTTGTYTDVAELKYTSLTVGGRMNMHFGTTEKVDPYVGISVGYSANKMTLSAHSNNPSYVAPKSISYNGFPPLYIGLTIGMRYYFTDNIGMHVELGVEKASFLQAGLALKF